MQIPDCSRQVRKAPARVRGADARIFDEGGQRAEDREQRAEENRAEGKRSGLGVTLLRSVPVNLAELGKAQKSYRAARVEIFANKLIKI
jgi:hypothetical protein